MHTRGIKPIGLTPKKKTPIATITVINQINPQSVDGTDFKAQKNLKEITLV